MTYSRTSSEVSAGWDVCAPATGAARRQETAQLKAIGAWRMDEFIHTSLVGKRLRFQNRHEARNAPGRCRPGLNSSAEGEALLYQTRPLTPDQPPERHQQRHHHGRRGDDVQNRV